MLQHPAYLIIMAMLGGVVMFVAAMVALWKIITFLSEAVNLIKGVRGTDGVSLPDQVKTIGENVGRIATSMDNISSAFEARFTSIETTVEDHGHQIETIQTNHRALAITVEGLS